ncbi:hypothetical protein [uncultured Lactobacillus sp.]|uniref:hypothetical protein n=1 Tax=uncultured Lactobacillus sp. TaxID=153152 RepID=UPI002636745B|nr:hypothetical protein [uncultured Lactobacillus sp.]
MAIEWINYKENGELNYKLPFSPDHVKQFVGQKTRVTLKDNSQKVGFASSNFVNNTLVLWTFVNLDENTHQLTGSDRLKQDYVKIPLSEITKIETILNSNPRSGMQLTNKFKVRDKEL